MKKELLTVLFLLLASIGFSQETNKVFYMNIPGRPPGDPYSIYSESRSCNCFVEIGLLSKVDTTYLCKVNDDWIINDNGDWKLFWSLTGKHQKKKISIKLDSYTFQVLWKGNIKFKDRDFFSFRLISDKVSISTSMTYYFDPNIGIVGFNVDGDDYFIDMFN
jgi:hypothetical protein